MIFAYGGLSILLFALKAARVFISGGHSLSRRRRMLSASLLCGCPQGKAREEEPEQAAYGNEETGRAAQAQSPGGRKGFVFVDKHRLRRDGDFFLSVYSLIQKKFFFLRRALKNNCAASQVTVRKKFINSYFVTI